MPRLRTVLLHHTSRGGSHYDWLLEDPAQPGGLLWAGRVARGIACWEGLGSFSLEMIAPHRRRYLHYEGPISQGRGQVRRVDEGVFVPVLWRAGRAILKVKLRGFEGRLELRGIEGGRWRVNVWREAVVAEDW